jgi:hypothetical protein
VDHDAVTGDEPLADGMHIAVRLRRDFTVSDATRLLAAARAAYLELNPGATRDDAAEVVTSATDAIFTLLERDGVLGPTADRAIAAHSGHGLQPGGWRAEVTIDEPHYLPPRPDCFNHGDVFALPTGT